MKRCANVLTYRASNGPFVSIDDLWRVRGIGKGTLERLKRRSASLGESRRDA